MADAEGTPPATAAAARCPVCGDANAWTFAEISQIPVHCNVLCETPAKAVEISKADIRLSICRDCGHVFNAAFNALQMEYSSAYEASLDHSPLFNRYADEMAARLIERYNIHGKLVLEIGCGQGKFLRRLCQLGGNRGLGFDPSYRGDGDEARTDAVSIVSDFYSERYANHRADLVCCRQVLEHIASPREFLGAVRRAVGDRPATVIFFEVPNALFTLRDLGIWDLIYEHCSYFCPTSLSRLFHLCGFEVIEVSETYGSQFLYIDARSADATTTPAPPDRPAVDMTALATGFADHYHRKLATWRQRLDALSQSGRRTVIWGGGSKGVTFLNVLKARSQIDYVVDINPAKHGMYVPGTGQPIVAPDTMRHRPPDTILVMNPLYEREIAAEAARLGVSAAIAVV
jgi:SAM-dependent methyltransferase